MNWLHGPWDDHAAWCGLPVFAWRRLNGILQLISGVYIAADLLPEQRKRSFHNWLEKRRQKLPQPVPHPGPSILRRWMERFQLIVVLAAAAGTVAGVSATIWAIKLGHPLSRDVLRLARTLFPVVLVFVIPLYLMSIIILKSLFGGLEALHAAVTFRWLVPFTPLFAPERFDTTVLTLSAVLFILSSLLQILLS
jgi:hypothetical protein